MITELLAIMYRAIRPVLQRVLSMLARGLVWAVAEDGGVQTVQVKVLADELLEGVENPQHYGMASHLLPGSEILLAFLGGDRSHGVVIKDGCRRYRPRDLEPGEVCVYSFEDRLKYRTPPDGSREYEPPPDWVGEPPEDPADLEGLCRIVFRQDRRIEIICQELTLKINGAESIQGAPSPPWPEEVI